MQSAGFSVPPLLPFHFFFFFLRSLLCEVCALPGRDEQVSEGLQSTRVASSTARFSSSPPAAGIFLVSCSAITICDRAHQRGLFTSSTERALVSDLDNIARVKVDMDNRQCGASPTGFVALGNYLCEFPSSAPFRDRQYVTVL